MKKISDSFKLSYSQAKYNLRDMGGQIAADSNYYRANSHRLRSPELSEHADIVISGCSFSYGVGVPEEMSWGVQVANHFNLPYHNLSSAGKGTPFLVDHLFSYFKNYGHPKILICLFPEPNRMQIYSNPKQMISRRHSDKRSHLFQEDIKNSTGITFNVTLPNFKFVHSKYSQAPHHAENVIPIETASALAFQYIRFLEMYCKLADIKLIWSTWDVLLEIGLENYDHDYENFISTKNKYWHSKEKDSYYDRIHLESDQPYNFSHYDWQGGDNDICDEFVDCHSEFREKYGKNWDVASDLGFTPTLHHWGIHHHMHVADFFINEIKLKKWA